MIQIDWKVLPSPMLSDWIVFSGVCVQAAVTDSGWQVVLCACSATSTTSRAPAPQRQLRCAQAGVHLSPGCRNCWPACHMRLPPTPLHTDGGKTEAVPTWMHPRNSGSFRPARHLNMNCTCTAAGRRAGGREGQQTAQWVQAPRWLPVSSPARSAASCSLSAQQLQLAWVRAYPLDLMRAQLASNELIHQHPRVGCAPLRHRWKVCR